MTSSTRHDLDVAADRLDVAQLTATPIAQLSDLEPLTVERAYAVQQGVVARHVSRGERVVGLKLGFTSQAKARQMGVSDVILGTLTDAMRIDDGGAFARSTGIHPRIEPEVAFLLADSPDGLVIDAVAPALEIIDSRYRDFRFDLGDVIADNTSAAAFVLGPWTSSATAGDIGNRAVVLEVDGRLVQTGSTAAILGDPRRAVAAASRLAAAHGFTLEAGMILLAGAATAAVEIPESGVVEASVAGIGRVGVRIERSGS